MDVDLEQKFKKHMTPTLERMQKHVDAAIEDIKPDIKTLTESLKLILTANIELAVCTDPVMKKKIEGVLKTLQEQAQATYDRIKNRSENLRLELEFSEAGVARKEMLRFFIENHKEILEQGY